MRISLDTPVATFPRIGSATNTLLKRLGVATARDVLHMYPIRYEDYRNITPIANVKGNTDVCIKGSITLLANRRSPRKRISFTEGLITDATGSVGAIWFNQGYLAKTLHEGEQLLFAGRISVTKYGMQLVNPTFEKVSKDPLHMARIVPIYPTTKNLSQKMLRGLVRAALPLAQFIDDPIPEVIRARYRLMPLAKAVEVVHFPVTLDHAEQARKRIALQELTDIMLRLAKSRATQRKKQAYAHPHAKKEMQRLSATLPFTLTKSQEDTMSDIASGISADSPMNRLLDGDVGSGKTVLAHMAALSVARGGSQAVLLAPTDILATQHMASLQKFFPHTERAALFTRTKQFLLGKDGLHIITKRELLAQLASGDISYCIGTHALIQKNVTCKRLGLVIVDEQHRFGVFQRASSIHIHERDAGMTPHFLSLSATPIPRSLARIFFGGADISLLTEKPKGRIPVATKVMIGDERKIAYEKIRVEAKRNRQAFVICPIIEESDTLGVRAATIEFERLKKDVFPDLRVGLVHGKQSQKIRDAAMQAFVKNKIDILVATAVVEVGVDIPNATVMLIEGANRFGLAQLHQFRGRIGRSDSPSWCFAAVDTSEEVRDRISAFASTQDGFALAQKDLELRGPGTLFGVLQAGYPQLRLANLSDIAQLKAAQEVAKNIIKTRP